MQIKILPSPLISDSRDLKVCPLPGKEREAPLQMEISFQGEIQVSGLGTHGDEKRNEVRTG